MYNKIATILPLKHLGMIAGEKYFMALSHACDDPEYAEFYRTRVIAGAHVILDNSAVELGQPEGFDSYLAKATAMQATEIILPDYFGDAHLTLNATGACLRQLKYRKENADYLPRIMAIPQGKDIPEWVWCAEQMLEHREITTLGVSCRYTDMFKGNRMQAVLILIHGVFQRLGLDHPASKRQVRIHLLGAYADPRMEVAPVLHHRLVQGVDSSYPAVFASHNLTIVPGRARPPRNIDFIKDHYNEVLLRKNIEIWRQMCLNPRVSI